jgi:hypothetical protein
MFAYRLVRRIHNENEQVTLTNTSLATLNRLLYSCQIYAKFGGNSSAESLQIQLSSELKNLCLLDS